MNKIAFRTICTLLGAFGLVILLSLFFSPFSASPIRDWLTRYSFERVLVKVSFSAIRGISLIYCLVAGWFRPKFASVSAWVAFLSYVIGATVDEVYLHGFFKGVLGLMPVFYVTAGVHALSACVIWILWKRMERVHGG